MIYFALISFLLGIGGYIGEFYQAGCPLCHIQRIMFVGGGFLFYFLSKHPSLIRCFFTGLYFLGGTCVGLYHTAIQWKWVPEPFFCQVSLDAISLTLEDTPLVPSCQVTAGTFLGFPLSLWTAGAMIMFCILAFTSFRPKAPK